MSCMVASLSCTVPDVSGVWRYDWQTREATETWDGHFHGELTLAQLDNEVTGEIGYPDPDPYPLEPHYRDLWLWPVYGQLEGDTLHLHAPAPNTAWDDPWWFDLTVTKNRLSGPSFAGDRRLPRHPFTAVR